MIYPKRWLQNAGRASVARTSNDKNKNASQRSGCGERREQKQVQSFEMRRRDGKKERPTANAQQMQLSTTKNTQLEEMETRIEKLREIVARFDEGEGHASLAIEASYSDQQKMAKLEAMIRSIEQAVNKCSNRNEGRDRQRARMGKLRSVPLSEHSVHTEKAFCKFFTIQFECDRRTINPHSVIQILTEKTGERPCQVTAERKDSFMLEMRYTQKIC